MKKRATEFDTLLDTCAPPKNRCSVTANKPLAAAIVEFLDLKQNGDDRVAGITLSWFFEKKLRAAYEGPKWYGTVRDFVRLRLERCPSTGLPL